MKLSVLFLCLAGASAFTGPAAIKQQQTSALSLSSSVNAGDDWTKNKPLKAPQMTTPKPVRNVNWLAKQAIDDVVLDADYTLTWAFALLGPLICWYHPAALDGTPSLIGVAGGAFHMLFAALLWVQTRRVRCVFEKDSFEFYNIKGPSLDFEKGAWLEKKPNNYVVGNANRWKYDTIINYGFFPSQEFPVICYFKETETPKEQWGKWFAAFDSYQGGQPHFFPGICNVNQFKEQMELRGVKRKEIPTLKKKKQN